MIQVNFFAGEKPFIPVERLPAEYAAVASQCNLLDGELKALDGNVAIPAKLVTGHIKSIYWYERSHWFSFKDNVDAVKSPIAQDPHSRTYFTGQGKPKITAGDIALGANALPEAAFDLGVPKPESAPLIKSHLVTDEDAENYADDKSRYYVMTYVTGYGEEGSPSEPSSEVVITAPTDTVTLTLPVPAINSHNITRKRVYRLLTSSVSAEFALVADIDVALTEIVDDLLDADLAAILETEDYDLPPENMQGLTAMAGGFLAGFSGNEVSFCEAFIPYAWPKKYRLTTAHNVVAIAAIDSALVVVTTGYPYLLSGTTPDAMSPRKLELRLGCVSKRSMVDMGSQVVYASKQGLVGVSGGGVSVLTSQSMNKKQWARYNPETLHAYVYEGFYIAFYGDTNDSGDGIGGFVYDIAQDAFVDLPFYATAGYSDPLNDALYLVIDGALVNFSRDWNTRKPYTWKSKVYVDVGDSFSAGFVDTTEPEKLGITWIADGVERVLYRVGELDSPYFRLPDGGFNRFQFELIGTAHVKRIQLGPSMGGLS